MTLVRPPTLRDLIKNYGGIGEAVKHLTSSGFTPEDISWRFGLPYYLIRLYMEGFKPRSRVLFSTVTKVYDRLALLRSRRGKETELMKFFMREDLSLDVKVRLALGRITDENLKIGEGIIEKALCAAAGVAPKRVRELFIDYGEYGEVASMLIGRREPRLTVDEVYEAIRITPKLEGVYERVLHISSLLQNSTPDEARYIIRLLLEDLKLGYRQETVMSAIARLYGVPVELLEKVSAIIGLVEGLTMAPKGEAELSKIRIRPGLFLRPQLAQIYDPEKVSYPARVEYKYDGSRLQIHRWGSQVRLFSRRGIEKSSTLPEVVDIAMRFKAQSCIVDCEVVALGEDGTPLPFQYLLERTVPRELSTGELRERMRKVRLTVKAFDILYLNGVVLLDMPLRERRRFLLEVVPAEYLAEGVDCEDEVALMRFYNEALKRGLEGVIVKDLNSPYELGRRTYTWLKIKPERDTVDCVIVKALYGKGKRAGLYSSFLMAVRDAKERKLYTIGKVSNLPDEVMASLRSRLERIKIGEDKEGIYVKPMIVAEVTYQEIQETDEYTSGYALRVPKIIRFREDKTVEEIDDVDKLRRLYELQYERYPVK